jgi:glycosyltransferase involved in cell wall biosynthesis
MPGALVSILVPCYNAENWLAETLASALAQTWQAKEIIVVDDGSLDRSLSIARGFEQFGIRVIATQNHGASAARNTAIEASRGEWLQFLDADDLLSANKIECQMEVAARLGCEYALCGRWARFSSSVDDAVFEHQPLCADADPAEWLITKLLDNRMMHPGAWLISRALADKAGLWDTRLSLDDDGEYFSRVVVASKGVRYCSAAASYYRSGIAGSLSGMRTQRAWESAYLSATLCAGYLLGVENSGRAHQACANQFARLAYAMYPKCKEWSSICEKLVERHGGASVGLEGGLLTRVVTGILGWKAARRLQCLREEGSL